MVFVATYVLITEKETVCPIAATAEMVTFALLKNTLKWFRQKNTHIAVWYKCIQKLNKNIYGVDKKSESSFETCCPLIFLMNVRLLLNYN